MTRVVDGDTVEVDASANMPKELAKLKVRLRDVDTPEIGRSAKCESERQAGKKAMEFTQKVIDRAERILVRDPGWGKWGGRVVADLIVDEISLSKMLIEAKHGRQYSGGRRKSWCDKKNALKSVPPDAQHPLTLYDDNKNRRITCREARRHGIAPVRRGHPAYPFMRDRDGDGVVCN